MKSSLLLLGTIASFSLLAPSAKAQVSNEVISAPSEPIDVQAAFGTVYTLTQKALLEVFPKNDPSPDALQLESVELTFATTATRESSGGVKLWVVSGGYTRSKATGKQVTYTFKRDPEFGKGKSKDLNKKEFEQYLIQVLRSSRTIASSSAFGLSEIDVEVSFALTKKKEGGVEIELSPVTPTGNVSREDEYVHTIALNLTRVKKNKPTLVGTTSRKQ